ncbi:hypothetical protein [Lutibacter sp.]|uniref:lysine 5,6-aminomutase reactivase subunit KamB n=1 Tax=Lutibacter sp. TaxID=1925666 RepID=UPI002735EA59|nr:hypothetical protein [Lutibacter sp.]MDP3313701.1 hypothetical protein [Lutibacter sp.]
MPFVKDIENYKSLAIVGLEKNTGKTECLNYVLSQLKNGTKKIALTSIGVDGESVDQVTHKHKPEIEIYEGMLFVTPELLYKKRKLVAEVLEISTQTTALGRLITARAQTSGKVILSGPTTTKSLKELIVKMQDYGADLTIIDGALSRKSSGSPTVTEAMILTTGATVSGNIPQLVFKTEYVFNLINIEKVEEVLVDKLMEIESGVWAINPFGEVIDLKINSVLNSEKIKENLFNFGTRFYVGGAITDSFIEFLKNQKLGTEIEIIVRDFTKIFVSPEMYYSFLKRGGKVSVLQKTKLIAICINPTSPEGYNLNSDELKEALELKLLLPVYDVKKL